MTAPAHRHHQSILGLVLSSVIAFGVADLNIPLLLIAVPGVLGSWFLTQAPVGKPLPRLVINLLLLGILGYTFLVMARAGFSVETVCEIITLTLIAKILDRRSERDFGQVISISVFLCIGTILTSNAFGVGLLLLICLGFLITSTIIYQIERLFPGSDRPARLESTAGTGFRKHTRRLAMVIFAGSLVLSIFVFLTVPRKLGAGLFGDWGNPGIGQVTGFADEVELGTPGFISPSSTPVLDLEIRDQFGQNRGGPGIVYYLRGAVLDTYDGGRWTRNRDASSKALEGIAGHMLQSITVGSDPRSYTLEQRITIRNAAATRSHLFAVWRPVKIEPGQSGRIYYSDDGTLIRNSESGKFEYTVYSRDFEQRSRNEGGRPWFIAEPVQSPDMDTDRFIALATNILQASQLDPDPTSRPAESVERAASAIQNYFDTGFEYTLEAEPVPGSTDPTEWFLFDHQAGHCEYYASAMTTLCRSVGLNARVITGYVATEYNEATGHYVVRQSNAHAWVEVEVGPGVWRTFDPTPSADFQRVHEPSQSLFARARRMFDAAEYAWIRAVVGFDADRQRTLVKSAFKRNWSPDESLENFAAQLRRGGAKAILKLAAALIMVVVTLALISLLLSKYRTNITALIRRLGAAAWLMIRPRHDVHAIYLRLLHELARRGEPKPAGVPLLTHVQHATRSWPNDQRLAAHRLADALYRARFDAPNDDLVRHCAEDLERIRRTPPRS